MSVNERASTQSTWVEHGPSCIPHPRGGFPHLPASYGRYLPIDLDDNNRHQIDQWCERHPGQPRPQLGWGVCRHGFGLQHHQGALSREQAEEWARQLNQQIRIGERAR